MRWGWVEGDTCLASPAHLVLEEGAGQVSWQLVAASAPPASREGGAGSVLLLGPSLEVSSIWCAGALEEVLR